MKSITTGTEDFKEFINNNYYFSDKSQFIEIALKDKVSLFTRPRRFGKTLNMSMLYYFLSNKEKDNSSLFNGLKITQNKEMMKLQNQFPVIFVTLKNMKGLCFEECLDAYKLIFNNLLSQFSELFETKTFMDSTLLILERCSHNLATLGEYKESLCILSRCLEHFYDRKVVVLVDEYDVPLQAAYQNGYYDEMSNFLSGLFGSVFKTNGSLYKGVMTGCLRIAKESIFSGLNNFSVYSIFDELSEDCFGFTQEEVNDILDYYRLSEHQTKIKEWYDGYLFGTKEIYNPWSTLYYVKELLVNNQKEPSSYWANTSGNDIVYNYIQNSDYSMKEEFEELANGKAITKIVKPELTYREMDDINNIYSFLLFTGYLKVKKSLGNNTYELIIPNKEVNTIYINSFLDYFTEFTRVRKNKLYDALVSEDVMTSNDLLNDILENSISYYDNYESFYHGFLIGLFNDYKTQSNKEAGKGRFDVVIFPRRITQTAIVIECKHSESDAHLVEDASLAAKQIVEKGYMNHPDVKKHFNAVGYGISFNKKQCFIVKSELPKK